MPASGEFAYLDLQPSTSSFLEDVIVGLSAERKSLPPKYFYDALGSKLFDAICELPEYYPTRTELAMLTRAAGEIAQRVGPRSAIIEYGSGSGRKTRTLIQALQPLAYVAIDISREQLQSATAQLSAEFREVRMFAVCADYTTVVPLKALDAMRVTRRLVYFPGSTIGNFTVPEARQFLVNSRDVAGHGGAMLVGVDLKKDSRVLHAAYNDAQGVTAAFNLNVLRRINRELNGDFDMESFQHHAFYDQTRGRIEMHLVSARDQKVHVDGHTFSFAAGESIHTENSYKYSVEQFQQLAHDAGFEADHYWVDAQKLFSMHFLTVRD